MQTSSMFIRLAISSVISATVSSAGQMQIREWPTSCGDSPRIEYVSGPEIGGPVRTSSPYITELQVEDHGGEVVATAENTSSGSLLVFKRDSAGNWRSQLPIEGYRATVVLDAEGPICAFAITTRPGSEYAVSEALLSALESGLYEGLSQEVSRDLTGNMSAHGFYIDAPWRSELSFPIDNAIVTNRLMSLSDAQDQLNLVPRYGQKLCLE